jgi:ERCC4-related helicase
MHYQAIVGKINEYLLNASFGLAKWLDKYLPKSTDWWNKYVISKLSDNQKQLIAQYGWTNLSVLDLSALLRVADRNKYVISQRYYLNYSEIECIKEMFRVRNRWAHCSTEPILLAQIIDDLETLKYFYGQIETNHQLIKEISEFITIVKTEGITDAPISSKKVTPAFESALAEPGKIKVGDIVHLIRDKNIVGMVQSISSIGDSKKYQVFIGSAIESLFADQIELHIQPQTEGTSDITDLLLTLTARQIVCPSSNSLYSLNSARIDFVPYQFRPVLKLIKSDTPRLLIADSVGVGKTIEAGLILKEMQVRSPLDIILIICPKPLVAEHKWEREMKDKFGEQFTPADSSLLRSIIRDYTRDKVWDDRYKRLIIPYSQLTDELLNGIKDRRSHSGLENMDPPPIFDMIIVDEAHHIRNSTTQAYNVVKFLCEHANTAVFLTATPIQLGNNDLYTLLNLLFPDDVSDHAAFEAMAQPNEHINKAVKLLRSSIDHKTEALDALREAVLTDWGNKVIAQNPVFVKAIKTLEKVELSREQRVNLIHDVESLHSFSHMINRTRRQDIEDFCVRRAITRESEFTKYQRELHDKLLDFIRSALSIQYGNISPKFLMSMISRQASSCLFGLAPFIRGMVNGRLSDLFDEGNDDAPDDDHIDPAIGKLMEMATDVIKLADQLPEDDDPKFDTLAKILEERQKPEGGKTIVFSTFRNTLNYLLGRIKKELKIRVEQVNGSVPDEERFILRERFTLPKDDPRALDVLLFSEVGAEGLDYQFCDAIVNYDLPWNPMRIDQRIGRIDRRGQKSEVVHIYNCITKGTIDAEIYDRCHLRINVFEKSIGECSDILGDIENSIKEIVLNPQLTPEECSQKLEKMMDNQVDRIEENRRLEEEGKEMFGIDISNFIEDVEKSENPWVSSNNLKRLVDVYLTKRLKGENQYISSDKLKLKKEEKYLVLEDYHSLYNKKTGGDKIFEAYLNSPSQVCPITFTQDEAKEKRKSIFLTLTHPLIQQAAKYFSEEKNIKMAFAVSVNGNDVPAAEYPFSIYSWEYTGLRPRVEFIPISSELILNKELMNLLQEAITVEADLEQYDTIWRDQDEKHFLLWKQECERYKAEIKAKSNFRVENLAKGLEKRKLIAEHQLVGVGNTKIKLMRQSQIERLESAFEKKKLEIESSAKTADIHTTLIANGVLIVREM